MNNTKYSSDKMATSERKLLETLDEARKLIIDGRSKHGGFPISLGTKLNESIREFNTTHKNASFDWLNSWKEFMCNPVVDISPTAKPRVLRGYFEKLYSYDEFMRSDAKTLYVFGVENELDRESTETLGEVTTESPYYKWPFPAGCVIHCWDKTFTKGPPGTPEKPAKNIYFLKAGEEPLATEDLNGKRMYVGHDEFRSKYECKNFTQLVNNTLEKKVEMYEAFFSSNDNVLIVVGGEPNCPALKQIKKRPEIWVPSDGLYSDPMKLPAIGYADGEEIPPAKAIFYLGKDDTDFKDYIFEKNYTARCVHFD